MTENQNIPWRRISVEAAAIVASILLAFAIDAWWDEREKRSEEAEILLGLQKEFVMNREFLGRRLAAHKSSLLLCHRLLEAIYSGKSNTDELDFEQTLLWLISPSTTDIGGGALDGLVNSGRIELLSSKVLREKLAGWAGVFGEVRDDELNNSDLIFDRVVPYLIRSNVSVSGAFSLQGYDWPEASKPVSEDAEVISRLLSDPEFKVLLELRYGYAFHTTGEFEEAITAADEILREIEKSIAE